MKMLGQHHAIMIVGGKTSKREAQTSIADQVIAGLIVQGIVVLIDYLMGKGKDKNKSDPKESHFAFSHDF